jgi:hypothetical protein
MLASKRGQCSRGGWETEEELRFFAAERFVLQDGDIAVGAEAVDEARAWGGGDAEAAGACSDAAVGLDEDGGTMAKDVRPPRAFGRWTQGAAVLVVGELPGGQWSHGQFAVAFVGVAIGAPAPSQNDGAPQTS